LEPSAAPGDAAVSLPAREWRARKSARKLARANARENIEAERQAPKVSIRWPWSRKADPHANQQVLRALVQINILPRPR
jgi:hypothetical protein